MRKNLVLARVGRNSLHRSWIDASKPRDWDLRLCPFQEIAPQDDLDCIQGEVIPGPKWTGLRQLLNSWDGWRNYEQIWLPDDDILASQDAIGAMFDAARRLDFKLFAPGCTKLHTSRISLPCGTTASSPGGSASSRSWCRASAARHWSSFCRRSI
ncbi:hypothetical protein ACFQU2_36650 [Siccirubricoccus deserti]